MGSSTATEDGNANFFCCGGFQLRPKAEERNHRRQAHGVSFVYLLFDIMDERNLWPAIYAFWGIGPLRFYSLLHTFGSCQALWNASEKDLKAAKLSQKFSERFVRYRKTFNFKQFWVSLKENKTSFIISLDTSYPKLLKELDDHPPVLYLRGQINELENFFERPSLAVVGTRKISSYGKYITEKFVSELIANDFCIVSGLMYGVDEQAHRAALNNNGVTIGVWAGGIDTVFSGSRLNLARMMEEQGLIVSEFPIHLAPSKGTFPARNRIVSGLSLGVLVVEGTSDSGSLITAGFAAQSGREVFAVPGPLTSRLSDAPIKLIKSGAKVVSTVEDILEEFRSLGKLQKYKKDHFEKQNTKRGLPQLALTKSEMLILEVLKIKSMHIDDIVRNTKLCASSVLSALTTLELVGKVESIGGGYYEISNS